MTNMSYCRFENTAADMRACLNDLMQAYEDGLSFDQFMEKLSSDYERRGVREMAGLMQDMADAFEQLYDNTGLTEEELADLEAK